MLDGAAAGVEDVDELVAGEVGEFLVLLGFLLLAAVGAVDGEQVLDDGDFFRGLEAGQAVGLGAEDQGVAALEEHGAAGVEADADEVTVGGEVGGGIAVLGEHLVLLFGGTLDLLEGGVELGGVLGGEFGGGLGVFQAFGGFGDAAVGLVDHGGEAFHVGGADVLFVERGGIGSGGGGDGFRHDEVVELGLVEVSAFARDGGCWDGRWGGRGREGVWHGGVFRCVQSVIGESRRAHGKSSGELDLDFFNREWTRMDANDSENHEIHE